jgi:hypothetical protein
VSAPGPVGKVPATAAPQAAETASRAEQPAVAGMRRLGAALGNQAMAQLLARQATRQSPGRPLEALVRADLEGRFGADLGSVRVHDDPAAATAVGAVAYTIGEHIVLGGKPDHGVLAHEVTHVLQQRGDASGSSPSRAEGEARQVTESGDAPVTVREGGQVALARLEAQGPSVERLYVLNGAESVYVDGVLLIRCFHGGQQPEFEFRAVGAKGGPLYGAIVLAPGTTFEVVPGAEESLRGHGYTEIKIFPRMLDEANPAAPSAPARPRPKAPRATTKPPAAEPDVSPPASDVSPATEGQPATEAGPLPPAPGAPLPAVSGQALKDEFSDWFLDDQGLGARLARYAREGNFSLVDETLDEISFIDRDDVSLVIVSQLSDADLDAMLRTPQGKVLNLRMYDELRSGWVDADQEAAAERLLRARERAPEPVSDTEGPEPAAGAEQPGADGRTDSQIIAELERRTRKSYAELVLGLGRGPSSDPGPRKVEAYLYATGALKRPLFAPAKGEVIDNVSIRDPYNPDRFITMGVVGRADRVAAMKAAGEQELEFAMLSGLAMGGSLRPGAVSEGGTISVAEGEILLETETGGNLTEEWNLKDFEAGERHIAADKEVAANLARGNAGERLAADVLGQNGHTILFAKPDIKGTNAPGIDLVTLKGDTVYFVDNKALTRSGNVYSVTALNENFEKNKADVLADLRTAMAAAPSEGERAVFERAINAINQGRYKRVVTNANIMLGNAPGENWTGAPGAPRERDKTLTGVSGKLGGIIFLDLHKPRLDEH